MDGRSREHLARYGLVEVGNEWSEPSRQNGPAPGEIAADIVEQKFSARREKAGKQKFSARWEN
jgi:hypothetical protein